MKVLVFFLATLTALSAADAPPFLKGGEVFAFGLVGVNERILASVEKDEGNGWLKILTIKKRETLWLNLAQVQVVVPIQGSAEKLRAAYDIQQIQDNLRRMSAAADRYYLEFGKRPTNEALFSSKWLFPEPLSVAGENYHTVDVSTDGPLKISTADGTVVSFP